MPHITWKCCLMWISFMIEWRFMVIIPLLPFSFCQSKVDFLWLWWKDMTLINCVRSLAFTVHGTFSFYLTVTQCQLVTRCGCNLTIMVFVYFGHILHTPVTYLHCVSVENFNKTGKCLLINWRNIFAIFVDTTLVNGGWNQIIFQDLFFGFCPWFLVYSKSTLNPVFFRASSYSHFAVLNISSIDEIFDSLFWMEFRICFMTFGRWFDKLWM